MKSAEVSRLMFPLVGAEANEGLLDEELDAGWWFGLALNFGFGVRVGFGFGFGLGFGF